MRNIIRSEWMKTRRCQIFLVGIVALALCPLMQYGTQLILAPEYRDTNYNFAHLVRNVIWGNSQIFLPLTLVMTGGWLIDRETANDTLKNIATIPVPMSRLLGAKLLVTAALAVLFGIYSVFMTLLTGMLFGLSGLTISLAFTGGLQIVAAALTTCLVCMPVILISGRIRGGYLGGSILTFFLGYSMLFFKSGFLFSAYPFSAALILVGFDLSQYNGAKTPASYPLALFSLGSVVLITLCLLLLSDRQKESQALRRSKRSVSKRGVSRRG